MSAFSGGAFLVLLSLLRCFSEAAKIPRSSLSFTSNVYRGFIPENSVGRVYVTPSYISSDEERTFWGVRLNDSEDSLLSVRYRIRSGDSDNFFKPEALRIGNFVFLNVRLRSGDLNVLNREKTGAYDLQIRGIVRDSGGRKVPSDLRARLSVIVSDTNDLDPFFQSSKYHFRVPQDTPLHTSIGSVTAEDADEGLNSQIYYSFDPKTQPSILNTFSLHPISGSISLIATPHLLHDEEPSSFYFNVIATDRGYKRPSSIIPSDSAAVKVTMEIVNHFDPFITITRTDEEAWLYARISLSDKDEGIHGDISSFHIISGNEDSSFRLLQVNESHYLLYGRNHKGHRNLTFSASDNGIPPRTSVAFMSLPPSLTDTRPLFAQDVYNVHVNESVPIGTPLIRLGPLPTRNENDDDVFYSIVGGNRGGFFRVSASSGVLLTDKALDAESRSSYTLALTGLSSNNNSGRRRQMSVKVRIFVVDVNDNDPVFVKGGSSEVFFNENEPPGTLVHRVKATDKDSGENGYISYSLANLEEVPFEIDHFSGQIKSSRLIDYETQTRIYKLIIRARDWGHPFSRQVETSLIVRILDVNDNRPIFTKTDCSGKISRRLPLGSEILSLNALDFDAGNSVSYRIVSGNEDMCFDLDSKRGILSTQCDLLTLPSSSRELNITASDGTHYSSLNTLAITLQNEDSLPQNNKIVSSYESSDLFVCKESNVASVLADIIRQEAESNSMDNASGSKMESNEVIPRKEDGFGRTYKIGSNIHSPVIKGPKRDNISLLETTPLGSLLYQVNAEDRDTGFNGLLTYVISSGNEDSYLFNMNTYSGALSLEAPLDFESKTFYTLNISICDQGTPPIRCTSLLLEINILDANDNPPTFTQHTYTFSVKENAPQGTPIGSVTALDPDSGTFGFIHYFIKSTNNHFALNRSNGSLTLLSPLDREEIEAYDLIIGAGDGTHVSFVPLRVVVLDVNDEPPLFTRRTYTARLAEDYPIGVLVGTVHALDGDTGLGGRVSYAFKSDDTHTFSLGEHSGVIRLAKKLDFESKQLYNLTILALDGGGIEAHAFFIVEVLDMNENNMLGGPSFGSFVTSAAVPENQPPGTIVHRLTASSSSSQDLTYSLLNEPSGAFTIQPSNGSIHTSRILDKETTISYWFTVLATDNSGLFPLSTSHDVYIRVLNENDNVPYTKAFSYEVRLEENADPYSELLRLEAFDDDLPEESDVAPSFSIVGGNPQSLFAIEESGVLTTTNRRLDREAQAEHVLHILLCDNGSPSSLNSTVVVIVKIGDVNDNKPTFLEKFYNLRLLLPMNNHLANGTKLSTIMDDSPAVPLKIDDVSSEDDEQLKMSSLFGNTSWRFDGEYDEYRFPLFRAIAYDLDEGSGPLLYSLKSSSLPGNGFSVDSNNGTIYVSSLLHLSPGEKYDLLVRAQDADRQYGLAWISLEFITPNELGNPLSVKPLQNPVQVLETDSVGRLLAVIPFDGGGGGPVFFRIVRGDEGGFFYVTVDKGSLILAKKLIGPIKTFNLTISLTNGHQTEHTSLQINVLESLKGSLEFLVPYRNISLSENTPVGTLLVEDSPLKSLRSSPIYSLHYTKSIDSMSMFLVSPLNGAIVLSRPLDREVSSFHHLLLSVKDQTNPSRISFSWVHIHLSDSNDNGPSFIERALSIKLLQNVDVGTFVLQARAVDHDHGRNGRISYSLESGNVGGAFSIHPRSGIITVAKRLTSHSQGEYMLSVRASDEGVPVKWDTLQVHLVLSLWDSSPPSFDSDMVGFVEIPENEPSGSFVLQLSALSGSPLRYSLLNSHDIPFTVMPSTGILLTSIPLDYEVASSYTLSVGATDILGQTANASISIHVLDINDNLPAFASLDFVGFIPESASVRSIIQTENGPLRITATDRDSGLNSYITFTILEEPHRSSFSIEPSTGILRTLVNLDYESRSSYTFSVIAADSGSPLKLSSELVSKVTVSVLDVNDSPPVFEVPGRTPVLYLPTYKGVHVTQVHANDPDEDSSLTYSLKRSEAFRIDPSSGDIFVQEPSYLSPGVLRSLEVLVSDGKMNGSLSLPLELLNSAGSGLVFGEGSYYASIMENSSDVEFLLVVNALGTSLVENLSFRLLSGGELFSIGVTSGVIKSRGIPFDREERDNYEVVVEAMSGGYGRRVPRVARVAVNVRVLDLNDNAPLFEGTPYYSAMSRKAEEGSIIFKVAARDPDIGPNGDITYQLVRGNGDIFRVGRKSGQILLRKALTAYKPEYHLTLAAYDSGNPPLSSEAHLVIKVVEEDVPSFSEQLYRVTLPEDNPPGSPILTLRALSTHPNESRCVYLLHSGDEEKQFDLDFETGALRVRDGSLDYETKAHYQLFVRALDTLSGSFATAIILLDVENVNDCTPIFLNASYNVRVKESTPLGTSLLTIGAIDADSEDLEYYIPSNTSAYEYLSLNPSSGEIFLKKQLDYELNAEHHFVLSVRDGGGRHPLSSNVDLFLTLENDNDNAPVFEEEEYIMKVNGGGERGMFVGRVRAVDRDGGGELTYRLAGQTSRRMVTVNGSTGVIYLESVPIEPHEEEMVNYLNISVTDGVYSNFARVVLLLQREESYSPSFGQVLYHVSVREDVPPNSLLTTLTSSSSSSGGSSNLIFTINSLVHRDLFHLDPLSGEVSNLVPFDMEETGGYEVPLLLSDSNGRHGFSTLKIGLLDVNDNPPVFELGEYVFCKRNASVGDVLWTFVARDPDERDTVNFSLRSSLNSSSLDVEEVLGIFNNGQLYVKSAIILDAEEEDDILEFFVVASDGLHSGQVPVKFCLSGPTTEFNELIHYVNESAPLGSVLAQLENDGESNTYKKVSAELNAFDIEPSSGSIYVSKPLDREKRSSQSTTFLSEDPSTGALVYTRVLFQILDENDSPPIFNSDRESLSLNENTGPNNLIYRVIASDADFGRNGQISYSLEKGSPEEFSLDENSGWISTTSKALDYETTPNFTLKITASDGEHTSEASLEISLLNDNDNPPEFLRDTFYTAVNEGALPGTIVYQLDVMDKDGSPGEDLRSYITSGDPAGAFRLRSNKEIIVSRALDRETQSSYRLEIYLTDGKFISRCSVFIEILDENDNPPECPQGLYEKTIPENSNPGTYLLTIASSDIDEHSENIFSLHGSHLGNAPPFSIDSQKGDVFTGEGLDREDTETYELTVRVSDASRKDWFCESKLILTLSDVNDNAPAWSVSPVRISVKENAPSGSVLSRVTAEDHDMGVNASLTYSLPDKDSPFSIHPVSGVLTLSGGLDRETRSFYNISLTAEDGGGLSSTNRLLVTVIDFNDNPPLFASQNYFSSLSEGVRLGYEVLRVFASSKDEGQNALISYSLIGGNEGRFFTIHRDTGVLSVVKPLDYESNRFYLLTVEAKDGGDPPLSNWATVNLTILDVNDNAPRFNVQPSQPLMAAIEENAGIGSRILGVKAFDSDSGVNGVVHYYLEGSVPFSLHPNSGELSLIHSLDYETTRAYSFRIFALDKGSPPLNSSLVVIVNVTDVNDHPPLFHEKEVMLFLPENKPLGSILHNFSVSDADGPSQSAPFTFDIRSGNEESFFTLRGSSLLLNKRPLLLNDSFSLNLRAFDNGDPPLYSDGCLLLKVVGPSVYPPVIKSLSVVINSYEDGFNGAEIGRVPAYDDDPYDTLAYALVVESSPFANLFSIEKASGVLTSSNLDVGSYVLNISVSDGQMTAYAPSRVVVNLIDDALLEHSASVRLAGISVEEFLRQRTQSVFIDSLAKAFSSRESDILILSVVESHARRTARHVQSGSGQLEVFFVVQKDRPHEYYSPDVIRKSLSNSVFGGRFKVVDSLGACKEYVLNNKLSSCPKRCSQTTAFASDKMETPSIVVDGFSYVYPLLESRPSCICSCNCPSKACSQCSFGEEYPCSCDDNTCNNVCNCGPSEGILSFDGSSSGVDRSLNSSVAQVCSQSFTIKSRMDYGTIFSAYDEKDSFCSLEILNGGEILYRWNFGESTTRSLSWEEGFMGDSSPAWHSVKVENSYHHHLGSVTLQIDDGDKVFSSESGGVNPLKTRSSTSKVMISFGKGFNGCLGSDFFFKESNLTHCLPSCSCLNGGICLPDGSCDCPSSHSGPNCGFPLLDASHCASSPCLNGGACTDLPGDYHCTCPLKLSGKRCDYGKFCNPNPCQNAGICEEGFSRPICHCKGFRGLFCTSDINECEEEPCLNGGSCFNTHGSFQCLCPPHAYGPYCQTTSMNKDNRESSEATKEYFFNIEEVAAIITSLFGFVLLVVVIVLCRRIDLLKRSSHSPGSNGDELNMSALLQGTPKVCPHNESSMHQSSNTTTGGGESLSLFAGEIFAFADDGPLSADYTDTIRSYKQLSEQLGETLPRTAFKRSGQKPICPVAPSVSSKPVEDDYFWDSFDLKKTPGEKEIETLIEEDEGEAEALIGGAASYGASLCDLQGSGSSKYLLFRGLNSHHHTLTSESDLDSNTPIPGGASGLCRNSVSGVSSNDDLAIPPPLPALGLNKYAVSMWPVTTLASKDPSTAYRTEGQLCEIEDESFDESRLIRGERKVTRV